MISGFRHKIAENCTLLGYYTAISDNFLMKFWDNLLFPSSGFKNPKERILDSQPLTKQLIGCPKT